MDRGGNTSRFPNQIKLSGHKRLFPASDKSKKERIKSLSAVSSRSYKGKEEEEEKKEMGGHVLHGTQLKQEVEDGRGKQLPSLSRLPSSNGRSKKRLKVPRKRSGDGCPGAYCSSVPRKLRSAMRKRNGESLSQAFPGSKKLNGANGCLKLSERDGGKKSTLNAKQGNPDCYPRHSLDGPISKDEEEVAEALYALAGMFDNNDYRKQSQLDDTSLYASAPPQQSEVPLRASEVINEEIRVCAATQPAQDAERSFQEIANDYFPKQILPDSSGSENAGKDNNLSQVESDSGQPKLEEQNPFCNYSASCIQHEPDKDLDTNNRKQVRKPGIALLDGKPDVALGLSTTTATQLNFQNTASHTEKDALWPGLESIALVGASSSRSFDAKLPPWLDAALCAMRPGSLQDCTIEKVPKVNHHQKSRKRCATHLYISRLIQVMQLPKGKDRVSSNPDQPRPREILNHGVPLSIDNMKGVRGGLGGTRSDNDAVGAFGKRTNETARRTSELQKHFQGQIRGTAAFGTSISQKQTFNFLSLSTDGGAMESNFGRKGVKNEVDSSKPTPVPPSNSRTQQSTTLPFSFSQSCPPPVYMHQSPATSASWQAQLQPPAYVSHTFGGSYANTLTKQHNEQRQQQEQQHQQRLWATHLAAQYRASGTSASMNQYHQYQYRGSQNGRPDLPMVVPCTEPGVGGAKSSLPSDALGSQTQISQHQQFSMAVASSLPHTVIQKRDHLSSVYDDNGGGFRAGTALRFQLLCNDRL